MDNEVLDVPEFLERVQDDKELLVELLDIFVPDFEQKRPLLEEAIKAQDFDQIKNVSHSIKGSSGNVSAKLLREVIIQIENMGKNSDVSNADELLKQLDVEFAKLLVNIEELKKEYNN